MAGDGVKRPRAPAGQCGHRDGRHGYCDERRADCAGQGDYPASLRLHPQPKYHAQCRRNLFFAFSIALSVAGGHGRPLSAFGIVLSPMIAVRHGAELISVILARSGSRPRCYVVGRVGLEPTPGRPKGAAHRRARPDRTRREAASYRTDAPRAPAERTTRAARRIRHLRLRRAATGKNRSGRKPGPRGRPDSRKR